MKFPVVKSVYKISKPVYNVLDLVNKPMFTPKYNLNTVLTSELPCASMISIPPGRISVTGRLVQLPAWLAIVCNLYMRILRIFQSKQALTYSW